MNGTFITELFQWDHYLSQDHLSFFVHVCECRGEEDPNLSLLLVFLLVLVDETLEVSCA